MSLSQPALNQVDVPLPLLRVLHVGVGNRGVWPLDRCDAATGFRPAALCDVNAAVLEAARARFALPESACFTDVGQAIAHAEVDCIIACVPTKLHVPVALKAIERGLPILIEKGMAPDWESATRLVRAARGAGAKVCVAQNYRYNSAERTLRRALHDPGFPAFVGKCNLVQYTQFRVRPFPRTLDYPFASVWDMSCHHFDTMLDWLGPITEMTAHSWRAGWSAYEHDNNTTAFMRFGDTAVHYAHTHDAARAVLDVQLHGERGALRWSDETGKQVITFNDRPIEQFGSRPISEVPMEPAGGESDMLRDFHAMIVQGVEPGISVGRNIETMAACELMRRSIVEGRTVRRDELPTDM